MTAFIIGLRRFPDNLAAAQTMAFATLSIPELFRAYTSRSERYSLFAIGVLSNKYMQWAVLASLVILLSIISYHNGPLEGNLFRGLPRLTEGFL